MNRPQILDHDVLAAKLNELDKTLLQSTRSSAIPMLEEVVDALDCTGLTELTDDLGIPILTDICHDSELPEPPAV